MNSNKTEIEMSNKGNNGGFLSPLGCGFIFFVVCLVVMLITVKVKSCNEKKKYENESWYLEMQANRQKYDDSIKNLNELAKTNPDEYNRIIQQGKMWKYVSKKEIEIHGGNVTASIQSKYDGYIHLPEPIKQKNKAPRTKILAKVPLQFGTQKLMEMKS